MATRAFPCVARRFSQHDIAQDDAHHVRTRILEGWVSERRSTALVGRMELAAVVRVGTDLLGCELPALLRADPKHKWLVQANQIHQMGLETSDECEYS